MNCLNANRLLKLLDIRLRRRLFSCRRSIWIDWQIWTSKFMNVNDLDWKGTSDSLFFSSHFMEPEGSLPHSQVPATSHYPEPARSSPIPHTPQSEFTYTYCGHVEGCTTNQQKINSLLECRILINCNIYFVSTCTLFCFIQVMCVWSYSNPYMINFFKLQFLVSWGVPVEALMMTCIVKTF